MTKIITFGEIMMRLQPFGYKKFLQADSYESTFGGGEANVAVSLAQLGEDVAFLTKLPEGDLGQACINKLRGVGVDTRYIARGGDRLGLYFCEKGASQRASKVIYDRSNSAINDISENDFDMLAMLDNVEWLHFTGITPALSKNVENFTEKLLNIAKKRGITVSCDLNYRSKLWTRSEAKSTMSRLMQYVDVLISNEEDCKDVFGIESSHTDINKGSISTDGYIEVARIISEQFNIKKIAFTLRESVSASVNNWSAILVDSGEVFKSKKYIINIVDRVGGGDSFGAGLIYSMVNGKTSQQAIEFAVAASALKHTIEGDFNYSSLSEIEKLVNGDGSGRVQR